MFIYIIRTILTGALLLEVWFSTHWSVALCFLLIGMHVIKLRSLIASEQEYRIERQKAEHKMFKKLKKMKKEHEKANTK